MPKDLDFFIMLSSSSDIAGTRRQGTLLETPSKMH